MANPLALVWVFLILFLTCTFATQVSYDGRAITINGERKILLSGSIHYPRSSPEMWPDLINKAKLGGLDAIDTYVFWNAHEPYQRMYNFSANLNLIRFLKTIQAGGLYAVLRIGPYVCAEWNFGGLPGWLKARPGCEFRTYNEVFMREMQNFTNMVVDMVKQENLFASQGGPIILSQIENEYGNVMSSYGEAGIQYLNFVVDYAKSLDIGVPWFMCQQSNAPHPIIDTCNGFYCDKFTPNNPNSPKMWTENWTGWFKSWGDKDPYRPAEDLAFAVARFFQSGGTYQNYYMYHGGTNFGRSAGGPYITTSYDYDAPLNEYGGYNQPKYGHLKQLHDVLHSIEKILTYGNVTTDDLGNSVQRTIYTLNSTSSCFFGNANETAAATVTHNGIHYIVPAWSVSILPDCRTVAYNTAKVNTQTTLREKISIQESFNWTWRSEGVPNYSRFNNREVTDQKINGDMTDNCWYATRIFPGNSFMRDDIVSHTLRIAGTGHVMHVFINGEYLGSKWGSIDVDSYMFEMNVKLNPGDQNNTITISSNTVGLPNYGAFYENKKAGITNPIELIATRGDGTNITHDLFNEGWWNSGCGFAISIIDPNWNYSLGPDSLSIWETDNLPFYKRMTWYRTTFKAPVGNDPIVLDLQGLSKGLAFVNNNGLGRYWPSYVAANDGCSSEPCDYRGAYTSDKCVKNCGQPTQRWYHVPRGFLRDEENELQIYEEFGGDLSRVRLQIVVPANVCGNAYENQLMKLSCEGRTISAIKFASFGEVTGTCGSFKNGTCQASNDVVSIIQSQCVGKPSCSVKATRSVFGTKNCANGVEKRLVVDAICR